MTHQPKNRWMKVMLARLALCSVLATISSLAVAVRPNEAATPVRSGSLETSPIDRGGSIESVNREQRAIVIEGVSYSIPVGSVPIHWQSNKVSADWTELKSGMQIRFTTVSDEARKQLRVREIWVTDVTRRPSAR